MASPADQQVLQWVIPPGQAEVQYSPQALGQRVLNFDTTRDGTLRTVPLITPYETTNGVGQDLDISTEATFKQKKGTPEILAGSEGALAPLNTVFHTTLFDGCDDLLLISAGNRVLMHKPWAAHYTNQETNSFYKRPYYGPVITGLSGEGTAFFGDTSNTRGTTLAGSVRFPHQFVVMNDYVIFNNGVDQARIITPEGISFKLGFSHRPSVPIAEGPTGVDIVGRDSYYPNSHGYSWEGKIGTAGDTLANDGGGILAGEYQYYIQYEDQFGNRSATSNVSNTVRIEPHSASPLRGAIEGNTSTGAVASTISAIEKTLGVEIKDVQRQFLLRCSLPASTFQNQFGFTSAKPGNDVASTWTWRGVDNRDHNISSDVIAVNIYRTPDIKNIGPTPRFVARIPASNSFDFPDNVSDAELGDDMVQTVPIPIFKLMCTHQGRLIIGNISGSPGMVMRSEQGFPGTFSAVEFVFPDSSGQEITALYSHNNQLLAFTENSIYSMDDFAAPTPISTGVGCVAPHSIQVMRDGSLIWLARDGFYAMNSNGINLISKSIERTFQTLVNRSRFRMATSVIDPESHEYRCAVCPAGSTAQSKVLCFDGTFWREVDYNMHIASFAVTRDSRELCLMLGSAKRLAKEEQFKFSVYHNLTLGGITGVGGGYSVDADALFKRGPSVYVTNRETIGSGKLCYFSQKALYRSGWLRADQNALTPVNVRTMYIGLVDTEDSEFIIRFFKNGSTKVVAEKTVRSVGLDNGTGIVDQAGAKAVIGVAKTQRPRVFWRKVAVNLSTVNSWCFEIETTVDSAGGAVEISAFAFDMSVATGGNPRARVPGRKDK